MRLVFGYERDTNQFRNLFFCDTWVDEARLPLNGIDAVCDDCLLNKGTRVCASMVS